MAGGGYFAPPRENTGTKSASEIGLKFYEASLLFYEHIINLNQLFKRWGALIFLKWVDFFPGFCKMKAIVK